jgi:hypothetical protein
MELRKSLVAKETRLGMRVRVAEDARRPGFEGMFGTVKGSFGDPEYPALDVQLENGRLELFWFYQLEKVGAA